MSRYFFHLRDSVDTTLDPEGMELPDLAAAQRVALAGARDILSCEIKNGSIDLRTRIDVEDELGSLLHSLPLRQSFEIIEVGCWE